MKFCRLALSLLLGASALASHAGAQGIPRIRASIVSFDGKILTVTGGPGKDDEKLAVGVLPTTRYMRQESKSAAAIKMGDYLGATITKAATKTGADKEIWHAQEAHLLPDVLRGSGEGLYEIGGDRSMAVGAVTAISAKDNAVILTLHYRGLAGKEGAPCTGRAIPAVGKTALQPGCFGDAEILVAQDTPVTALVPADKTQLVPGAVITLSVLAGSDGRPVTPGLIFEPPPPVSAAKPAPSR